MIFFRWAGCDEMDEVIGDGHAELLYDDPMEITFAYHNGDETVLKAKPETNIGIDNPTWDHSVF